MSAKGLQGSVVGQKAIPEIVSDFVAQMTEQGTVGFTHAHAALFAEGVVGLGQIERDDAAVVSGHHGLRVPDVVGDFREKIECQTRFGHFVPGRQGKSQAQQGIEQMMLGAFDLYPILQIFGDAQIRNVAVMTASSAISRRPRRGDQCLVNQPRAGVEFRIGAKLIERPFRFGAARDAPAAVHRLHSQEFSRVRQISETMSAIQTLPVIEMENLGTMLAFEQFH